MQSIPLAAELFSSSCLAMFEQACDALHQASLADAEQVGQAEH